MFSSASLKAKNLFMLHYVTLTMTFGPLIELWTKGFKSKLSYFRQSAQRGRNCLHITKSLADRHQLLEAYLANGLIFKD